MNQISQITSDPNQSQTITLDDGSFFTFSLSYSSQQTCWFLTDLTYNDFELQGMMIVVTANLLYQFKNRIPFGLACFGTVNREPTQQQDFSSGTFGLFVLTADEVKAYQAILES